MEGKMLLSGRGAQENYFVVRILPKGEVQFPDKLPDYSSAQFWDARYKGERGRTYDWLLGFEQLKKLLLQKLADNKQAEILIVGCGNSEVSERLYQSGYHYITNIDFSEEVISDMQERLKDAEDMDYYQMDVCSDDIKEIESNTFELILDKATFDSVLCRENPLPAANFMLTVSLDYIQEIERILAPGGTYVMVSSGNPQSRVDFLKRKNLSWNVQIRQIRKGLLRQLGHPLKK